MLERFKEAFDLFSERLLGSLLLLGATLQGREFLEGLISQVQETDQWIQVAAQAKMSLSDLQQGLLGFLALFEEDQPGKSAEAYEKMFNVLDKEALIEQGITVIYGVCVTTLFRVESLLLSTSIYKAESVISRLLNDLFLLKTDDAKAILLNSIGFTYTVRGEYIESEKAFKYALAIQNNEYTLGVEYSVMQSLWLGDYQRAYDSAQIAKFFYQEMRFASRLIRAVRLQGQAALALGQVAEAEDHLQGALVQARSLNQIAEEIPTRIALAELRRQQGDYKGARELLDDVWEAAERGPFLLYLADAWNVLAQIERDEGNRTKAIDAATAAYRFAWYDGPPFAYHWGLQQAKAHLSALGAPEPSLPPFEPADHEAIPDLKIDL